MPLKKKVSLEDNNIRFCMKCYKDVETIMVDKKDYRCKKCYTIYCGKHFEIKSKCEECSKNKPSHCKKCYREMDHLPFLKEDICDYCKKEKCKVCKKTRYTSLKTVLEY